MQEFLVTFAPEIKLDKKSVLREMNKYHMFAPSTKNAVCPATKADEAEVEEIKLGRSARKSSRSPRLTQVQDLYPLVLNEDDYKEHVIPLNIETVRNIASLNYSTLLDEDDVPAELYNASINALTSKSMTPEEEKLGSFTQRKLKNLGTWKEWEKRERKQIDQFQSLDMYDEHIHPSAMLPDAVVLQLHWQYAIKRDCTRRSCQRCDGST